MKEARIIAVLGGTGSGKTWRVKNVHLKPKPARLVIWDFKRDPQFNGYAQVVTAAGLVDALARKSFSVRFQPSFDAVKRAEQFDWFCELVHHFGNMTVWVEELAQVTKPNWAPGNWSMVVLTGREYGGADGEDKHLEVVATSQRPAGVDKDFLGNATLIECGVLEFERDMRAAAVCLRTKADAVQLLRPGQFLQRKRGDSESQLVGKPLTAAPRKQPKVANSTRRE
jgi:hypothetical protein